MVGLAIGLLVGNTLFWSVFGQPIRGVVTGIIAIPIFFLLLHIFGVKL